MSASANPIIAILGPTGSGKSRLGLDLAAEHQGEIISCDALQVYRHMDIGTAKPGAEERARVPHHMIDLREPGEDFTAGDYQRLGREAVQAVLGRGSVPFVVGGTGFYFRALIDGFFEGPARSEELRGRMRRIIEKKGARLLHRALRKIDPRSAARITEGDAARIIRAYEVYLLTGKTMSWWQDQPRDRLLGFRCFRLAVSWPRETLYRRIDERVDEMFALGLVEEVEGLIARFPRDCQAFKAIGYREVAAAIEGKCSLEQAREDMKRESRRYAKRQLTWFRGDAEIRWLDGTAGGTQLTAEASRAVRDFLA